MAEKPAWVSLSVAIIAIAGTLLGATVQHLLSIDRERLERFEATQAEAYLGYMNSLDKSRMARSYREAIANSDATTKPALDAEARKLELEFELEGGAALRRIAIYGDAAVVEAMAAWSRQAFPLPPCGEHWEADLAIWQHMRDSVSGQEQRVNGQDLGELALYCRPPSSQ